MIREIWEEGRDIRAQYQCDQWTPPAGPSLQQQQAKARLRPRLFVHSWLPWRPPGTTPAPLLLSTPRVVTPPDSPGTYTAAAVLPLSASARGNAICNNTFSLFHGSGCKGRNIAAPAKAITVSAPQMFIYFQMSYFVCFVTFKRKYNN